MVAFPQRASRYPRRSLGGTVAGDGLRHRDGTAWFFEGFDTLTCGQEGGLRISAPALGSTTEDLIFTSGDSLSILALTFSCHRSTEGCGDCPGCTKRDEVFAELRRR